MQKICKKYAKICSDCIRISSMQSYAFICKKYANICKICKHEIYMQNMHSHFADARDHENINRYSETDDMNSLVLELAFAFNLSMWQQLG